VARPARIGVSCQSALQGAGEFYARASDTMVGGADSEGDKQEMRDAALFPEHARMRRLRPFFSFYGSKWRTIHLYPAPTERKIIEPFAGSACYALHYPNLQVHLNDLDPVLCRVWHYLIHTSAAEIRTLPVEFEDVAALSIPEEAKWLIGFWLAKAATRPFSRKIGWARDTKYAKNYWCEERRERIASQVENIRHWTISNKSYEDLERERATWFVDPPYESKAGRAYVYNRIDYSALAIWCREQQGQILVCENGGATWLPFRTLGLMKTAREGKSHEMLWLESRTIPPAPSG